MDLNEEEIIKTKGRMYAVTTLSVIAVVIILFVMFILSIKVLFEDLAKCIYYVVEVNDDNRNYMKNLIEKEQEKSSNLKDKILYCDSLYKIVYTSSREFKLYCKNENNIVFKSNNNDYSELLDYIYNNGKVEKN